MLIESHLRNLKESLEVIEECIERGVQDRQRTLEFNTSSASIDMLENFNQLKALFKEVGLDEI